MVLLYSHNPIRKIYQLLRKSSTTPITKTRFKMRPEPWHYFMSIPLLGILFIGHCVQIYQLCGVCIWCGIGLWTDIDRGSLTLKLLCVRRRISTFSGSDCFCEWFRLVNNRSCYSLQGNLLVCNLWIFMVF